MVLTEVVVKKSFDAHSCQDLVVFLNKFKSEVFLCKGNQKANAKSIMGVISLMMKTGDKMLISFKGDDSEEGTAALLKENWFDAK